VQVAFDTLMRPRKNPYEDGFADRTCPGCGAPSRIIYMTYEHHMATYFTTVEQVLEMADARPGP
jgi:hypothetical protein